MGRIRQILKNTPVGTVYRKWRVTPLAKKCRWWRNRFRRDHLLFVTLPRIYNSHRDEPLDERKVIFVEHRLAQLSNSFTYLYDKLSREYDFELHIHYLRSAYVDRKHYVQNCKALFHDMATAKYVFVSESINIMGCFDRREGQQIVQLWHACGAFKRFGMSTAQYIFGMSEKEQKRHPANTNYTCVTISSPDVRWAYAEALDMKDREELIRPLGTSRTDIFFQEGTVQEAYRRLYENFPAARGKKVILFAPTFRGRVASAATAVEFDPMPFYEAFDGEYVLVLKHHPMVRQIPELPETVRGSFAYDATQTMSIEDLLCVSDICISDYSSLIFEYSLFGRPMLFFAYDLEEYFDWRGFYYPYEELTPGPVCRTNEELVDYIRHVDERFDREQVEEFRRKFMSACDGHATERILEDTMGDQALREHRKSL